MIVLVDMLLFFHCSMYSLYLCYHLIGSNYSTGMFILGFCYSMIMINLIYYYYFSIGLLRIPYSCSCISISSIYGCVGSIVTFLNSLTFLSFLNVSVSLWCLGHGDCGHCGCSHLTDCCVVDLLYSYLVLYTGHIHSMMLIVLMDLTNTVLLGFRTLPPPI